MFNAVVGARDLWETYLPVFESCVEVGQAQSVMCSYNSVNGVPTCAHQPLLTEILRNTFNFTGVLACSLTLYPIFMYTRAFALCKALLLATFPVSTSAFAQASSCQTMTRGPIWCRHIRYACACCSLL